MIWSSCRYAAYLFLMDKSQILRLKTLLEIRQQELRVSIEQRQKFVRRAELEPDAIDHAANNYEKETLLHQSNREQGLLLMVESALGRIQDGSFGKCRSCGEEIDEKRLQALPWTRYCIPCQEDFER
jgi:DnaK suppressor protein